MITKKRFFEIKNEVETAVTELFDYVFRRNNNYILILADAEYKEKYWGSGRHPYVISDKEDYYKEATRLEFSQHFLNQHYIFDKTKEKTADTQEKMYIEMMIYCHTWESTVFLKQLFRMQQLANGGNFPWEIDDMPESSKHSFIRKTIRDGFKSVNLAIANVMGKGFHTSLRNSFLHGEFDIDTQNEKVKLHTYRLPRKLQGFELDEINFEQWTEYFLYSSFLNYCFMLEKEKRRKNTKIDFKTDEFPIVFPLSRRSFKVITIYFDESRNDFYFLKSKTPYVGPPISTSVSTTTISVPRIQIMDKTEFDHWDRIANHCVSEVFDELKKTAPDDYIAFVIDAFWDVDTKTFKSANEPEKLRYDFSGKFISSIYLYPLPTINIPDLIRLQLEMLIYCHIWESKLFLKQLRSALQILEKQKIDWHYTFPDDRRVFINDLVSRYKIKNLKLGNLIDLAFHTSLRNAFAHSDYTIELKNKKIWLDTYKSQEAWDIPNVSFEEWSIKFILSLIIDLRFYMEKEIRRKEISQADILRVLSLMKK